MAKLFQHSGSFEKRANYTIRIQLLHGGAFVVAIGHAQHVAACRTGRLNVVDGVADEHHFLRQDAEPLAGVQQRQRIRLAPGKRVAAEHELEEIPQSGCLQQGRREFLPLLVMQARRNPAAFSACRPSFTPGYGRVRSCITRA